MGPVRKALLLLLLPSFGYCSLSRVWATMDYKQPRDYTYPEGNCSTCTTASPTWDGTTIKLFSMKKERIIFFLYYANETGSDIANVNVKISSFGAVGYTGIVNSVGLQYGTTGFTEPINQYYLRYLLLDGLSRLSYDPSEYDECHMPKNIRAAYTTSGNGNCALSGGASWTQRADHDKFFPDAMIPQSVTSSSFTVAAGSSQASGFSIWVSSSITPNVTYYATITITEGETVTYQIPVQLYVYNATMPDVPTIKIPAFMTSYDINYRHQGHHWPDNWEQDPDRTTRLHYYQLMHSFRLNPVGDDQLTEIEPRSEDYIRLTGSLYSGASNYINAPGKDTGDKIYFIGSYGSWQGGWPGSTTSSATLCNTYIGPWQQWFVDHSMTDKTVILYLQDESLGGTNVATWASWMYLHSGCQNANFRIHPFVTYGWPEVQSQAPYVSISAAGSWLGASSTSWHVAHDNFDHAPSSQPWAYNSGVPGGPHSFDMSEQGTMQREIILADAKKDVPVHMLWQTTYWTDSNESGSNNDLFTNCATFGNYAMTFDSVRGNQCYHRNNNDGVLFYPGHDTVLSPDYGFDGGIPSFRVAMYLRGSQDVEYFYQAYAINPTSATTIMNNLLPKVMFEWQCYDLGDCSYAYGERTWAEDSASYENARRSWAQIIDANGGSPPEQPQNPQTSLGLIHVIKGRFKYYGGGRLK